MAPLVVLAADALGRLVLHFSIIIKHHVKTMKNISSSIKQVVLNCQVISQM